MSNDFVGKSICIICGGIATILINKRLQRVSDEINNKVHPDQPYCNKCKEALKTCTFLISVRDGEREKKTETPYRTGKICGISVAAAERMFGKPRPPLAWVEDSMWKKMGLPSGDEDHSNPINAKENWIAATCQKCGTIRGVRPDWQDADQHKIIQARCLVCQPVQGDTDYEMFPHKLEKYLDFKPYAPKDPTPEKTDADQEAGSRSGSPNVSPEADRERSVPAVPDQGGGELSQHRDDNVEPEK